MLGSLKLQFEIGTQKDLLSPKAGFISERSIHGLSGESEFGKPKFSFI